MKLQRVHFFVYRSPIEYVRMQNILILLEFLYLSIKKEEKQKMDLTKVTLLWAHKIVKSRASTQKYAGSRVYRGTEWCTRKVHKGGSRVRSRT